MEICREKLHLKDTLAVECGIKALIEKRLPDDINSIALRYADAHQKKIRAQREINRCVEQLRNQGIDDMIEFERKYVEPILNGCD